MATAISELTPRIPPKQPAEFYELDEDGAYARAALDENGVYHSKTISEFWLRPTGCGNRRCPQRSPSCAD